MTTAPHSSKTLILASSSVYRKQQLAQLQVPFLTASPNIDESQHANESGEALSKRLAYEKAYAVAKQTHPEPGHTLIIGSDQTASFNGNIFGKPHHFQQCCDQLSEFSGNTVIFHTSVCIYDTETHSAATEVVNTHVKFRVLSKKQIEAYVTREQAFDCAGGFKVEQLGIALFEHIQSDDPSALIGLPLIRLSSMLYTLGVDVLS